MAQDPTGRARPEAGTWRSSSAEARKLTASASTVTVGPATPISAPPTGGPTSGPASRTTIAMSGRARR